MGGIAVGVASLAVGWALGAGVGLAAGPTPAPAKKAPTPAATVPQRAPDEPAYRWTDEQGVVHLSQGLASVPEQHRGSAVPLGIISSPPPAPLKAAPDPRNREALDDALRRARNTYDFLILARRYRTRGFEEPAREAVRRAAGVATTGDEWHAIAASYDMMGMAQAAQEARRRAGQISPLTR